VQPDRRRKNIFILQKAQFFGATNPDAMEEEERAMKKSSLLFAAVIVSVGALGLWGCPKMAGVASAPEARQQASPTASAEGEERPGTASGQKDAEQGSDALETAGTAGGGLKPIHFDFDQSFIRDDAKAVLKANAEWLKAHPAANIRIEGNCDERGTIEYNQALGQRRAQSAKKYLAELGVSQGRISLLSYGKEKPACTSADDECWQKNRRDDFVLVSE
jgi:peptidoglycan-associated lipoprotein